MKAVQIAQLREATAADHEAVEATVPLMADDLSAALYRMTLERLYGLVVPWEEFGAKKAPPHLQLLFAERRRGQLLSSDLMALGATATELPMATMPEFEGSAELLGAMYVMEGSRLGGQLLAGHVERVLGDVGRGSSRYLRGFGASTSAMWKQFVGVLEAEIPDSEAPRTISSAQQMFRFFGKWMRQVDVNRLNCRERVPAGSAETKAYGS